MSNNRDNFNENTKKIAASRVGYHCSKPDCNVLTIGPSMESNTSVASIGVAAHICAAAPGGKRYDEHMTFEERTSIDNCIWLCQTHATLIDRDEETYTVELLHQWKKDAEQRTLVEISNPNFFADIYRNSGDNLGVVEDIIAGYIADGNFENYSRIINQYKSSLSNLYDEFVLRYKIIYDVYCNRNEVKKDLETYLSLPVKKGIDQLVGIFIAFSMTDELKDSTAFCSDDNLKEIASLSIENKLLETLFGASDSERNFTYSPANYETVYKTMTQFVFDNKMFHVKDKNGEKFCMYKDEFYYRVLYLTFKLINESIFSDKISNETIEHIKQSINKIKNLDFALQVPIWEGVLRSLIEEEESYCYFYSQCPMIVKDFKCIKSVDNLFNVIWHYETVNIETLLQFSIETRDYDALILYMSKMSSEEENTFLSEHQFLYAKNIRFIFRKYMLSIEKDKIELIEILERYHKQYENDFFYHCIVAMSVDGDQKQKSELDWLKSHPQYITDISVNIYLDVISKYCEYDLAVELSQILFNQDLLFRTAIILQDSNDPIHKNKSKEIYLKLIEQGFSRLGLYHNLGVLYYMSGELEKAKKCFQQEYDYFKEKRSLFYFLNFRYDMNQFKDDYYLNEAKKINDPIIQNIVAGTLLKLNQYEEARKFFLRSLLIEQNNEPCIYGLFYTCNSIKDEEIDFIKENTVCVLKNETETITIALHEPDVLEGLSFNDFADCKHYSKDNCEVAPLMFKNKDDTVTLFESEYTIISVESINRFLSRVALKVVMNASTTRKIHSSNTTEFLDEITPILKESYENTKRIMEDYNKSNLRTPLTTLSKILGKSMLQTYENLMFFNKSKIRNNTSIQSPTKENTVFVLAYDSIITMSHLEMLEDIKKSVKLLCPLQVKEQILSEINSELSEMLAPNRTGSLALYDEKIGFLEYDNKSKSQRYQYLMKLNLFINSVEVGDSFDYTNTDFDFLSIAKEHKLFCESGSLALTQNIPGSMLVTDEEFLYSIARLSKINTIGICTLLTMCDYSWIELLDKIKGLAKQNFSYYFTPDLYNRVVELIHCSEDEKNGSQELLNWMISDSDNGEAEATEHHKNVIIQLFRDIVAIDKSFLGSENLLRQIAIRHHIQKNPDRIKEFINNTLQEVRIEIVPDEEQTE